MNRYNWLLLLALLACSRETFTEHERVHTEVEQALDNYHRAIEQRGLWAEVDYLDNSSDFFWVPPGYTSAISYDSVMQVLNSSAPLFKKISYRWDYLNIYPLSNELANYTGKLQSEMVDTTGQVTSLTMLETGTMIKRGSNWKILHGQSRIVDTQEERIF